MGESEIKSSTCIFISYYFPPIKSVGVIRNFHLAQIFHRIFSDLYILTTSNQKILPKEESDLSSFKSIELINTIDYRTIIQRLYSKNKNTHYPESVKQNKLIQWIIKANESLPFNLLVGEIDENNPATIDKKELIQWVEDEIIQYLGFVKDIREVIASSDCIVLPSYREAIARTITEGMAMGKPIITSQTAGCREAVEDGENGYLVEIKNSKALADTFLKFLSLLPEEKKLMGEIGRIKACNEFDDAIIASQINDIVYEILK